MEIIKRKSCRAVILSPDNEILLIKIASSNGWTGWITPGGGLDDNETELEGLKRELFEELGFSLTELPPKIWVRSHSFYWNGSQIEQDEVFYLVRTQKFEPGATELTDVELKEIQEIRWWKLEELESSNEMTAPQKLCQLVNQLNLVGVPGEVIYIGV